MNYKIYSLIIWVLTSTLSLALDINKPVAISNDGELSYIQSTLPNIFNGVSNYRKAGEATWAADRWVNVKSITVVETNLIDRSEVNIVIDPAGGLTNAVPVDLIYHAETNLIARAASALERVNPEVSGLQTLGLIKSVPPAHFIALARARFEASDSDQKEKILAATIEMLALFSEAEAMGINWRYEGLGSSFKTNHLERIEWVKE